MLLFPVIDLKLKKSYTKKYDSGWQGPECSREFFFADAFYFLSVFVLSAANPLSPTETSNLSNLTIFTVLESFLG